MRFLADMGISMLTVAFLQGRGFDVRHLRDEKLERMEDPDILAKARDEGRILLTHDLDFAELLAALGSRLPSVIIFRLRDMHPISVNHHLEAILTHHEETLRGGAIMSVAEGQIRVRSLPLRSGE